MQESRLFRILYYLLDKGRATAPELAEKFEVSVRTIYRDVDAISSAGIPIYVTTGRNGGIQFLDDYVLNKSFFSDSEKLEILSSLQSLSAVQYPEVDTVLNKLGAIFQIGLTDWIDVDFSRWGSVAENENKDMNIKRELETKVGIANSIYLNNIDIPPLTIKAIMINEVVPSDPLQDFYGLPDADYLKTTIPLLQGAGTAVTSIQDILQIILARLSQRKAAQKELDGFFHSPIARGSLGNTTSSKLSNGPFFPERESLTYSARSITSLSISFLACAEGRAA